MPTNSDATRGVDSVVNSSVTPLGVSATFTGEFEDVSGYAFISIIIFSDKSSTVGGFSIQWSPDGINSDVTENSDVVANVGRAFVVAPRAKFFRIVYTNDGIAQSIFRLKTSYHFTGTGLFSRLLSQSLDDNNYAVTVRAVMNAKQASGNYSAVSYGQATMINSLPVTIASNQSPILVSLANPTGSLNERRLGLVTTSAVADVVKTVYTEQSTNAQRSLVSSSASDAAAGTGARTVQITYLDSTMAGPFTETVTLNGTTAVNTVSTTICFIESMTVLTIGSFGAAVGVISLKAAAAGAGATVWSIAVGDNQTFAAHHYIPTGKTMNLKDVTVAAGQASGALFGWFVRTPTIANDSIIIAGQLRVANSDTFTREFFPGLLYPGPARFVVQVTPDSNSTLWYATIEFYDT